MSEVVVGWRNLFYSYQILIIRMYSKSIEKSFHEIISPWNDYSN